MATHPNPPQAILLAGMHRSGTSAAALALERVGWSLGADQLATQAEVNRDGFGENAGVVALNEKLLAHFGSTWFQLFDWPAGWEQEAEAGDFLKKAKTVIAEQFAGEHRVLLKDPRFCLTLPFWLRVLSEAGFATRVILQWRHPQAVAQSLKRRDSLPIPAGLLLWLHYTLSSERWSRGVQRAWLRYEDLLHDGARSLSLFEDLVVPESLDAGIDFGLAHQRETSFDHHSPLTATCESLMRAIESGEEPVKSLCHAMEVADLASVFNAFASSVTSLAAEVVSVGEQHSMALAVISEKDQAIEQVTAYARHCEAAVAGKDAEIAEALTYAGKCEAAVAGKDAEIAEALSYAGKCEEAIRSKDSEIAEAKARLDELEALRAQFLLRLLRKLRLLK